MIKRPFLFRRPQPLEITGRCFEKSCPTAHDRIHLLVLTPAKRLNDGAPYSMEVAKLIPTRSEAFGKLDKSNKLRLVEAPGQAPSTRPPGLGQAPMAQLLDRAWRGFPHAAILTKPPPWSCKRRNYVMYVVWQLGEGINTVTLALICRAKGSPECHCLACT